MFSKSLALRFQSSLVLGDPRCCFACLVDNGADCRFWDPKGKTKRLLATTTWQIMQCQAKSFIILDCFSKSCLLLIWSGQLRLASILLIQETCVYIYKIRANVIHTCRKCNLHIYMVIIYWVLTWNIVLYLLEPSLQLNCGKFDFRSFVYKSLKHKFFFPFELLLPFPFESFVSVLDNQ